MKTLKKILFAAVLSAAVAAGMTATAIASESPAPQSADATTSVLCDTDCKYAKVQGEEYTYRFEVNGPQGQRVAIYPTNTSVMQPVRYRWTVENGHDVCYYTVRFTDKIGGQAAIYTRLPGEDNVNHGMATVRPASVKSDTDYSFNLLRGATYTYRFEVDGPKSLSLAVYPTDTSTLQPVKWRKTVENNHAVLYYTVQATENINGQAAIYTRLPGQHNVNHGMATVRPASLTGCDTKEVTLLEGRNYTLLYKTNSRDRVVSGTDIPWGSFKFADDGIAKITDESTTRNGDLTLTIEAQKEGSTTLTATDQNGTAYTSKVNIEPMKVAACDTNGLSVCEDGSQSYTYRFIMNGGNLPVTPDFSMANDNAVITNVSEGSYGGNDAYFVTVKGQTAGADTLTASTNGTLNMTRPITVVPVTINADNLPGSIVAGTSRETGVTINTKLDTPLTVTVSDSSILTADAAASDFHNGYNSIRLRALETGTATVTLTAKNSTVTKEITVKPVTFTANATDISVAKGKSYTYTFKMNAQGVAHPSCSISDTSIATITDIRKVSTSGNDVWHVSVKGTNIGSTTLTAKTSGTTYTSKISVFDANEKALIDAVEAKGYKYNPQLDDKTGSKHHTVPTSPIITNDDVTPNLTKSVNTLVARMHYFGTKEFGIHWSGEASYLAEYTTSWFTYQATPKANIETDWSSASHALWYDNNPDFGWSSDDTTRETIGCNPYAEQRAEEITGIDVGELINTSAVNRGVRDNNNRLCELWSDAKAEYESRGLKIGTVPKKNSIIVCTSTNSSGVQFVYHFAYVEDTDPTNSIEDKFSIKYKDSEGGWDGDNAFRNGVINNSSYGSGEFYIYLGE
ncbi:MAG: hypothetical protein LKE53_06400 [Oscillospiraceae bacterium]|jgi:hypothetical protein|nr:hypothetical protein [Oscillospiraceae bacterium]